MRYSRPRARQVREKTIIMSGGLNEIVTDLELKKGELHQVVNYMELDGPYHGYTSALGYEVFDGKTAPSDIPAPYLPDEGNDANTVFLLEASSGFEDISEIGHDVVNNSTVINEEVYKFESQSFDFGGYQSIQVLSKDVGSFSIAYSNAFDGLDGEQSHLNLTGNWTIDLQIQPKPRASAQTIFEKTGCYKLTIDTSGYLTFHISVVPGSYDKTIAVTTSPIGNNSFTHVSVSAFDGTMRMALNGFPIVDTDGNPIETEFETVYEAVSPLWIGRDYQDFQPFTGYIDELRISRDYRWVEQFEPPIERYSTPRYSTSNWNGIAREAQRELITEVPGSGPVTGLHIYQNEIYALRNTEDGNAAGLYKSYSAQLYKNRQPVLNAIDDSQSGWQLIDNTFAPNGSLDAVNHRFSGSFAGQEVMLMVDGVSVPRIWDGTEMTKCSIESGAQGIPDLQVPPRYAKKCYVFDNRWVLGYEADDIFLSSKTDPRDFSMGFGDQLIIGDQITGFRELPSEALAVFCRNSIQILEKLTTPSSDAATPDYTFKMRTFSRTSGAIEGTMERMLDSVMYADDRGIINIEASDTFGDFSAGAISKKVDRIFQFNKTKITDSMVERQLGQYRLYFDDGTALYFTFTTDGLKGATFMQFATPVLKAAEGEDPDGFIWKFFASDDGYVYKMDSGTSFNGNEIVTEMLTAFYHYESPRNWKQFHRMVFECTATRGTEFKLRPVFDYDSGDFPQTLWWEPLLSGVVGTWNRDYWGSMIWGGAQVQRLTHYVRGVGTNMSIEIATRSKYLPYHIVHNAIVDYTQQDKQQ